MSDLSHLAETTSSEKFSLQNDYMLRVRVENGDILSQKGAMVAYQGSFNFEHHSAGMSRLAKKALSSDNVTLMHARGSGDLFLASRGQRIYIVHLNDEKIYVEPSRLLALDEGLDWNLETSKGASKVYAGGLWHLCVQGTGAVAVLADGQPVLLDCKEGSNVDRGALVAWSSGLKTSVHKDTSFKTWTGRASGESVQLRLEGEGWVLVQPSEGSAEEDGNSGGFSLFNWLPF